MFVRITPPSEAPGSGARSAILLQGPIGPFFGRLQEHLDEAGWRTLRVLFNGGDRTFHGRGGEVSYMDRPENWARWFQDLVQNFRPSVILVFGDQRKVHRDAKQVADALGIPFVCFEEGYIRPDYITMELGGNNAHSPLRDMELGPVEPMENTACRMPGNGFDDIAKMALRYFISMRLGGLAYQYYQHHRQRPLLREGFFWVRNFALKLWYGLINLQAIQAIVEQLDNKYFIVALQVHDDLQLTRHGEGWTLQLLVETSIATFAKSASREHHLVIKGHPLDRGHFLTRGLVERIARIYNICDRVHYIDDGSLGLLARHSRGMVTVNSTSAMVSFNHGKPVFAFGASVYERLTANGRNRSVEALERFWHQTPVFDAKLWMAFRAQMISANLVNGSFYIPREITQTCERVIVRLNQLLSMPNAANAAAASAPAQDSTTPALQVNRP